MLWVNHGPCLTAIGGSRAEYFREVRRQLGRFITSLDRMSESIAEKNYHSNFASADSRQKLVKLTSTTKPA